MQRLPRGVIILFVLSGIGAAAVIWKGLRPPSPERRLAALRAELAARRARADSCRSALTNAEDRFRDRDTRLDSLRSRIGRFEAIDPRGVPADSYDTYIEAFKTYNREVPQRNAAAETLQVDWRACRAIVRQHNTLADSVRELAVELGKVAPAPDSARSGSGGPRP